MLLLYSSVPRVGVSEDEVQFVVVAALVGTKHYGVGGLVVELAEVAFGIGAAGEELDVRAAAVLALLGRAQA